MLPIRRMAPVLTVMANPGLLLPVRNSEPPLTVRGPVKVRLLPERVNRLLPVLVIP